LRGRAVCIALAALLAPSLAALSVRGMVVDSSGAPVPFAIVASLELRTATFRLVNPPRDIPGFEIAIAVGRLPDGRPVVQKLELRYGQNSRARFAGRPISLTTQSSVLLR